MKRILFITVVLVTLVIMIQTRKQPIPLPSPPLPPPVQPTPPPLPEPGSKVEWLNFPAQQNRSGGTPFLTDIVSHLPPKMGNQYYSADRVTWAHETTHGINSHIRNEFAKGGVGFYVGNNKAVVMSQPKLTLRDIGATIPQNLRGSRYQLYFVNQAGQWNSTPFYCFDEWVAYTNGAAAGLETTHHVEEEDTEAYSSDVMIGALEFSVYALITAVAIDKHDPSYLNNMQFKEFLASELKRSIDIYKKGILMPEYQWDSPLEKNVKQNAEVIAVLKKMYGDQLTLEMLFAR